jgi:hypothetical protein
VPLTFPRLPFVRLLCLLLIAGGLLPGSALAKSSWTKPQIVGIAGRHSVLLSGIAANGGSLTVWNRQGVRARWRDAHGHLSPEQLISPPGVSAGLDTMAVAANGTAVIVYGEGRAEFARLRFPDGRLGPAQDVTDSLSGGRLYDVVFGPSDGLPRVLWGQVTEPKHPGPQGLFIAPVDANTGPASPLPFDDPAQDTDGTSILNTVVATAVNASGDAVVVWVDQHLGQLRSRVLLHSGQLGPLLTLSRPGAPVSIFPYPRVSLSPAGVGHALWAEGDPSSTQTLHARQVSTSGGLGPILSVGRVRGLGIASALDVASFSNGRSLAIWAGSGFGPVEGRMLSATGAAAPFVIAKRPSNDPHVVAAGQRAIALWGYEAKVRVGHSRPRLTLGLRSRSISASGSQSPVFDLFPAERGGYLRANYSQTVDLVGNAAGAAIATWQTAMTYAGRKGPVVLLAGRK